MGTLTRRSFSKEYKKQILDEADACTEEGGVGELLRREGLSHSHLSAWRAARSRGDFDAITSTEVLLAPSRKRYVGAAVLGLAMIGYVDNAVMYTMPRIMSMAQGIDVEVADEMLSDLPWFAIRLLIAFLGALLGGLAAGYVARRHNLILSFIAVLPYIFFALYIPLAAALNGALDTQRGIAFFWIGIGSGILYLAGGLLGGWFGGTLAAETTSLEGLGTVAGIRWGHLFWILPFIGYPWLASVSLAVYLALAMFVADLYYLLHPSLWLNIVWWIFFAVAPFLVMLTFVVIAGGIPAFMSSMHYTKRNGRFWRVLLYGLGAPTLSWFLAAVGVMVVHHMPKPIAGDWKVGIALSLGLALLAVLATSGQWVAESLRGRRAVDDPSSGVAIGSALKNVLGYLVGGVAAVVMLAFQLVMLGIGIIGSILPFIIGLLILGAIIRGCAAIF